MSKYSDFWFDNRKTTLVDDVLSIDDPVLSVFAVSRLTVSTESSCQKIAHEAYFIWWDAM